MAKEPPRCAPQTHNIYFSANQYTSVNPAAALKPFGAFTSVQGWSSIPSEPGDKHVFTSTHSHMVWYLSHLEAAVSEPGKSFEQWLIHIRKRLHLEPFKESTEYFQAEYCGEPVIPALGRQG